MARIDRLIERADAVEVRLAAEEWAVRQYSLYLEEYLRCAAEIQENLEWFSAMIKKSN